MTFVLDSWAVLRLLEGTEPAAGRVEQVLAEGRPVMSWINLGEVFYIVRRDQGDEQAHEVVRDLRLHLDLDLPSEHRVLTGVSVACDPSRVPTSRSRHGCERPACASGWPGASWRC
jgi:hypothetical protein